MKWVHVEAFKQETTLKVINTKKSKDLYTNKHLICSNQKMYRVTMVLDKMPLKVYVNENSTQIFNA